MTEEELYKKDEDITAESYIYKHTFELDGIRNNLGCKGFKLVISQKNALKALEITRKEEREKAINAITGTITYIESEIENGRSVSAYSILDVLKKLLNKE